MPKASDRYAIPIERRRYYSIRVRALTAANLYRAGYLCGVPLADSWDARLLALARFTQEHVRRRRRRG